MNLFGRKRYLHRQERKAETYTLGLDVGRALFHAGRPLTDRHRHGWAAQDPYSIGVVCGWQAAEWAALDDTDRAVVELAAEGIGKLERMLAGELPPGWDSGPQEPYGGAR